MFTNYPVLPDSSEMSLQAVATNVVRAFCGWHVTPALRETLTVDGTGESKILLPSQHVGEVHQLMVDGVEVAAFNWSTDGWVVLHSGVFPNKPRCVEVDLTHGYRSAPELSRVVGKLAARGAMSPAGTIVNQRAGTQSVTYASKGGEVATDLTLLQSEKEALAPYRLKVGW